MRGATALRLTISTSSYGRSEQYRIGLESGIVCGGQCHVCRRMELIVVYSMRLVGRCPFRPCGSEIKSASLSTASVLQGLGFVVSFFDPASVVEPGQNRQQVIRISIFIVPVQVYKEMCLIRCTVRNRMNNRLIF